MSPAQVPKDKKPRKPRKDSFYNAAERAVLDQFRDVYRREASAKLCGVMFREVILVTMFNFWMDDGKIPMLKKDQETCGKVHTALCSQYTLAMRNIPVAWSVDCQQLAYIGVAKARADSHSLNHLYRGRFGHTC